MADYQPNFFMMTPRKNAIENIMAKVITLRLRSQERTKSWLSARTGIDYGKVKRVLNDKEEQQLSFTVADSMLNVLGSSVKDELTRHVVNDIRDEIERGYSSIASGLSSVEEGLANMHKGLADIKKAMEKLNADY